MKLLLLALLIAVQPPNGAPESGHGEDLVEGAEQAETAHSTHGDTEYEQRLNAALRETRDVWGEALIAAGGATYDNIRDYLQPLLYSTGKTNTAYGMHNLLYAVDGGAPPYIVALSDGSRLAVNEYQSEDDLSIFIGANGGEPFGEDLRRLEGPRLGGGFYPILQTAYTGADGVRYEQESFAAHLPGMDHLVAFVRLTGTVGAGQVRVVPGTGVTGRLKASLPSMTAEGPYEAILNPGETLYVAWSPQDLLPEGFTPSAAVHDQARDRWKHYWDDALARGVQFNVPEALVMDCQRNLLIQNLMLRWRYSLGSVVYHNSFFQPESSDAMSLLALYGFTDEAREGLADLLPMTKGDGYYTNWERGEKLSHGAEYFFISRDKTFLEAHTSAYVDILEELEGQLAADPHGLLEKQRHCGDIPAVDYCTFHQAVCWQGMRGMAAAWGASGNAVLAEQYGALAARFRENLLHAVNTSAQWLPDGSLFVPSVLLEDTREVYSPITETRMGSYWNLCMPYAFASGLWDGDDDAMNGIVRFLHNHGATLLGLLRFNYYPIEIGKHHPEGLPGYWTTGYDNVYLPSYLRLLARQDEAERLILSFYGKLAHGQTRNTFVSGEGDTVGVFPGLDYRSFYGAVCSANNMAFLLPLRLMLVRESCNADTGLPEGLHLMQATPREWLEPGKNISVSKAPTLFGPVSLQAESDANAAIVRVKLDVPDRDPLQRLRLKVRLPRDNVITGVFLEDKQLPFDAGTELITLDGLSGTLDISVHYGPLRDNVEAS